MDFSLNVMLTPGFEGEGEGAVELGLPEGDIAEEIKNDNGTGNFRELLNRVFERENVSLSNFFDSDFGICVISLLVMHK